MTKKRKRPDAFIVTRQQLATLLASTPDRITKYVGEGMPVVKTGAGRGCPTLIDLRAALPWILQRRAGALDAHRGRYFKLQADRISLDIRHRAGELVDAVDVDARNAARTLAARERLLQLPGTALQHGVIATPEQEDQLRTLVHGALLELAQRGNYVEP